jgi:hypothetical protein
MQCPHSVGFCSTCSYAVVRLATFMPMLVTNLFNLSHSFATCAYCFVDAYANGLQGKGAAWAAKKYRGH